MKNAKIVAIVTVFLVIGLLTGCGEQGGKSKQSSKKDSTSIKPPQQSSPGMKETKGDEPPVLLPSIPKEQIPDGIANNVREEIQMLYTTTIGQFGALDILGSMGERAAPAVPFIVSLLPSEAGLEVRSGSGFRFYDGQGKESDMMNMSKRRVSIGRKAVETLVKIGKPSVDALISCLDTENQKALERATEALHQITGKGFGTNVAKWKAWHTSTMAPRRPDGKTHRSSIPAKLRGDWVERAKDGNEVSTLRIEADRIKWTRAGEDKDVITKYAIEDKGETVSFDSQVTYSRAVFGGQTHKGDVKVKIKMKSNTLTLEIGSMKVQESPGITVTRPPETHQYEKVVPSK